MTSIKVKKTTKLTVFNRYITNYTILKKDNVLNWSFIRYFINITILKRYDVYRFKDKGEFLALVVIKKNKAEDSIQIKGLWLPDFNNLLNVVVLQGLKALLMHYTALNFKIASITVVKYNKVLTKVLETQLDFEEDVSGNLRYLILNQKHNEVTYLKHL